MSTYYQYREVKVMIAHELMKRDGWKVYGYHADQSDSMTDYLDPARWGGIAEKNGFVLVVDNSYEEKPEEIREYTGSANSTVTSDIYKKIEKLKNMTVERGASEQEEATAKASIEKLLAKASEEQEELKNSYVVVGTRPGHMANPPRCNWHIEKDGLIIAKGNGLLKYASIEEYFNYNRYKEDMMQFKRMSEKDYKKKYADDMIQEWNTEEEQAKASAESHYKQMKENEKLFDAFNQLIGKFDSYAGGMVGNADYEYIKKTVTEYKKENKVVETEDGEIKEGQCIVLKTSFNYGCYKGFVYRIHEAIKGTDGDQLYTAVKLNGKLTKECNGTANRSNHMFFCSKPSDIQKWVDNGAIAFCNISEVETPYTVEKVVKVPIKKDEAKKESKEKEKGVSSYTYEIKEEEDTRDGSKLWIVKVVENLSREEYKAENAKMKELGAYYSRFLHGFLFREDPTELLKAA